MARYTERRQPFSRDMFNVVSGVPDAYSAGMNLRALVDEKQRRAEEKELWDNPIQREIAVGSGQAIPEEEVPIQASPMPGGPQMSPVAQPATGLPIPAAERTSMTVGGGRTPPQMKQVVDWDAMETALSQKYMRLGQYDKAEQVRGMIQDQKNKGMASSVQQSIRADAAGNFQGAARALETLLDTADSGSDYMVSFKDGNYVIMSSEKGAEGEPEIYSFPKDELETYATRFVSAASERAIQQEKANIAKTRMEARGKAPTTKSNRMTDDQINSHLKELPALFDSMAMNLGEDADLAATIYDPAQRSKSIASISNIFRESHQNLMGISLPEAVRAWEILNGPETPSLMEIPGTNLVGIGIGPDSYVPVNKGYIPAEVWQRQAAPTAAPITQPDRSKTKFEQDEKLTPYEQLGRASRGDRPPPKPNPVYEELGRRSSGKYGVPEDTMKRGMIQR